MTQVDVLKVTDLDVRLWFIKTISFGHEISKYRIQIFAIGLYGWIRFVLGRIFHYKDMKIN